MIRRLLETPVAFHTLNRVPGALNDVSFRCLRQVLHPDAESWMLDVGCGTGRYAGRWNCRDVGVDTHARYVQFATRRCGGRFLLADATRLAFCDGHFDAVFCVGVLHHLDDLSAGRMVQEMVRVCRAGGTVAMLEPLAPEPGDGCVRRGLARLERGQHFRRYEGLTRLLAEQVGPGLKVRREQARPFALGLYWLQVPGAATRP